ncbi:type I restriction enzyme endonuclease domain-containing protein [Halomicroarcula sp. GCM10025710]
MERQRLIHKAQNEVLVTEEREQKFKEAMKELKKAFSLVSPHPASNEIRQDMVFFEGILDSIKSMENPGGDEDVEDLDSAMKELVAEGVGIEDMVGSLDSILGRKRSRFLVTSSCPMLRKLSSRICRLRCLSS